MKTDHLKNRILGQPPRQRGFSAIEAVIALAFVAILWGFAIKLLDHDEPNGDSVFSKSRYLVSTDSAGSASVNSIFSDIADIRYNKPTVDTGELVINLYSTKRCAVSLVRVLNGDFSSSSVDAVPIKASVGELQVERGTYVDTAEVESACKSEIERSGSALIFVKLQVNGSSA